MADDLTEKYLSKKWVRGGEVLNPNFALLMNEINNYDFFVLQGGTRCFAPNQMVVTKSGSKPISKVEVGELVKTFNEDSRQIEWKPIMDVLRFENEKQTVMVKLKNGQEIVCSADHEFFHNGKWTPIIDILKSKP